MRCNFIRLGQLLPSDVVVALERWGDGGHLTRYRLRFLLQEIDLPRGATVLGRSPECHVTLEDPLVSRQHARIVIDDDGAVCEDLSSRNGLKINGLGLRGPTRLKDGDRVRIGTQELVFCEVNQNAVPNAKTTGFLRHCARCRIPYPQEVSACPNCGATEQLEEDTMTGQLGSASRHAWGVQLLMEVAQKALSLNRIQDAVRAMTRVLGQLEDRVVAHEPLDQSQVDQVVSLCVRTAVASNESVVLIGALHLAARATILPTSLTFDAILTMPHDLRLSLLAPVEALATAFGSADARTNIDLVALGKLQDIADAIGARGPADETRPNPAMPS